MDNSCEGLSIGGNNNWRECDAADHSIVERDNLLFDTAAVYDTINCYHMV